MVKNLPTVERSTKIRFGKNCTDDQAENTIVFNASNEQIDIPFSDSVYMTPLRLRTDLTDRNITVLAYNQVTKEVMDSGAIAEDILNFTLEAAVINGNVTANTVSFNNAITSVTTLSNVGVANGSPIDTLSVGSKFFVNQTANDTIRVLGNTYIQNNLVVDGDATFNGLVTTLHSNNTTIRDAIVEIGKGNTPTDSTLDLGFILNRPGSNVIVGFLEGTDEIALGYTHSSADVQTIIPRTDENINVHVYGQLFTQSNVGIINTVPIHTLDVGSNLFVDEFGSNVLDVTGNTSISADLTVDGDTLYVDSTADKVGINTLEPDAELHVVGNVYVSSNLTVDTNTLHVDAVTSRVGINQLYPTKDLDVNGTIAATRRVDNSGFNRLLIGEDTGNTIHTSSNSYLISVGYRAGYDRQQSNSIAIGYRSGSVTQAESALAVGKRSGETNQGESAVAIGSYAGYANQGTLAVSIGDNAGGQEQGTSAIAVGKDSGSSQQGNSSIAIGREAGYSQQGDKAIAIGEGAGRVSQGEGAIAIGYYAGYPTSQAAGSVIINGGTDVAGFNNTTTENALFINPVRNVNNSNLMMYNADSKEITYGTTITNELNVTDNFTVDTDTLYVDSVNDSVGINTASPDANLHVEGNVYISSNLTVEDNTLHVDTNKHFVGIETNFPDATLHVVGNAFILNNVTVGTNTLHVDTVNESVGVGTLLPDANLHVAGNTYVSDDLTVATDTLHVEASTQSVGIKTKTPDAELHVVGNVYVSDDFTVDTDTFHVDTVGKSVGVGTVTPDANLHVVGNVYVSDDLTVATDALHVEVSTQSVGVGTLTPDAKLHVVGNVYTSGDLTVDTDTFHVDATNHSVGIETMNPDANLHVVGNVYVSDDLTVDENTFHVDSVNHSVGIETKSPNANLHVVGNVYTSGDLTVDTDTFHVDATKHSIGIETKTPDANLHVVGNVYVSDDFTVDIDTFHVDAEYNSVGVGTVSPSANLHVEGNAYVSSTVDIDGTLRLNNPTTALTTDLTSNVDIKVDQLYNVNLDAPVADQLLVYDGTDWVNEYPIHTYIKIRNDLPSTNINTGDAVYVRGTHNANILNVGLAQSNSPSTMPCIGLSNQTLTPGQTGTAVAYGKALSVVTDTFLAGETVYVSNTVPGGLSNVKPYNNDLIQNVGVVTKVHQSNGGVFVTGIGRANDIPNAPIVADETDINYVYVNNVNNDLKKIEPANLLTQLQTFEQVSAAGNTVSNIMSFTNATTGIITSGNVEVGSNISVTGLVDATNKHVPMVGLDGFLEKSPIYFTTEGRYVVEAAEAEFLGNLTLSGNTTILNSESVTIEDRIFGIGANNEAHNLDTGIMMEHKDGSDYANVALIYHADEHRFSISYTQNTFTDDHILHYEDETHRMLIDLRGNVQVQNTFTVNTDTFHVNSVTDRVGILTTSPAYTLDVHGNSNVAVARSKSSVVTDATGATSKTTGAVTIVGGLGVGGDIYATNVNFENATLDSATIQNVTAATDKTSGALIVTGGVGVSGALFGYTAEFDGITKVSNIAAAMTKTSGALQVMGGVGVSGDIHATHVNFEDAEVDSLTVTDTTEAFSTVTGAVTIAGGLGVVGNVHAAQYHGDGSKLTGLVTTLEDVANNGNTMSNVIIFENATTGLVTDGQVGVSTRTPDANLHVVGNVHVADTTEAFSTVTGAMTITGGLGVVGNVHAAQYHGDGSKLTGLVTTLEDVANNGNTMSNVIIFENATTGLVTDGKVGVSTRSPDANLHVVGNVHVADTTEAFSTVTGALTITGGLGVVGNVHAAQFHGDGSQLTGLVTTLEDVANNGNTMSNVIIFENETTGLVTDGKVGVSTRTPDANLHVVGNVYVSDVVTLESGLITHNGGVTKKTYSLSRTANAGHNTPSIDITFTSNIFYAKITAQLINDDEDISTMVLEVSGGHKDGTTPSRNIAIGTKNIFGDQTNPNPWSSIVSTTPNKVTITANSSIDSGDGYDIFIEYTSRASVADGRVVSIVDTAPTGGSLTHTFGY
jgi:uncharacterized Zn finger protein